MPLYLFLDRRILIGNIIEDGKNGRGGSVFSTGTTLIWGLQVFIFNFLLVSFTGRRSP